jgi:hypothetical protein
MALPGDVTLVTLIGTWQDGNGNVPNYLASVGPLSKVVISPRVPTRFADYASNITIMPQRQTVYLNNSGSLPSSPPVQVIATDSPALAGVVGMSYQVAVILYDVNGAQLSPYSFTLLAPSAGGQIDISAPQYAVTGNSVGLPAM